MKFWFSEQHENVLIVALTKLVFILKLLFKSIKRAMSCVKIHKFLKVFLNKLLVRETATTKFCENIKITSRKN